MASAAKDHASPYPTCLPILYLANILFILGVHPLNKWVIKQQLPNLKRLLFISILQIELLINNQLLDIKRPQLYIFSLCLISYFLILIDQKIM